MNTTSVFSRNLKAFLDNSKSVSINQGGTSSSKTYSIMQLLTLIGTWRNVLISVVSESVPHLKRGVIRDFQNILGDRYDDRRYNRTDRIYYLDKGIIEFFPADDSSKMRGGRRDVLFCNECNNISKNAATELMVRTKMFTFLDFNPVAEFWAHEMRYDKDVEFIKSTYLDAKSVLPQSIVDNIEKRRNDKNWWRVYGLGEIGNIEGLVHPEFNAIDSMPDGAIEFYGLDFGYTNDPTSLVRCVIIDDCLYCDQVIYRTGLNNDQIAKQMISNGVRKDYDEVFADGSEPKSINEIRRYGINIKAAPKGRDSVLSGIQRVNQYKQFWTKRSVDAIKEQRNYKYIETDDGKITNKPIDDFNHAMDARRYGVFGKMSRSQEKTMQRVRF